MNDVVKKLFEGEFGAPIPLWCSNGCVDIFLRLNDYTHAGAWVPCPHCKQAARLVLEGEPV